MSEVDYTVAFVTGADKEEWRRLFEGYAVFYGVPISDTVADQVWSWLLDPSHELEGLIAHDEDYNGVGIIHVRACPRPLSGCNIGFVDDMFVTPDARGTGAADAMVERLQALARQRGWPALRWLTQEHNQRGRAFYDRYAGGPTDFILYHLRMS